MFINPENSVNHRRTVLHELLHARSDIPETKEQRKATVGWEEGVIEALTRELYPEVYGEPIEVSEHPYDRFVDAYENIREALGEADKRKFYIELLRVPRADWD